MSAIKEREAARRQAANQDGDAPNLSALEHLEAEESKRPRAAVVHEGEATAPLGDRARREPRRRADLRVGRGKDRCIQAGV